MMKTNISSAETVADQVAVQGFALVPNVFNPTEMDVVGTALKEANIHRSRAGIRHVLAQPLVTDIANDSRVICIAKEVLGKDAFPFHATLFDKSQEANWLVVWHQDTAVSLRERRDLSGWGPWSAKDGVTYAHAPAHALNRVLAIRIHLDDSTSENGPLRILPGTHNRGVLSDDAIQQLSTEISPVECSVSKGGLALMRPLAVHASSKSKSNQSRRVLHIEYAAERSFDGLELAFA